MEHPSSKRQAEVIRGKFGGRDTRPTRGDLVPLAQRRGGERADVAAAPEADRAELGRVAILGYN